MRQQTIVTPTMVRILNRPILQRTGTNRHTINSSPVVDFGSLDPVEVYTRVDFQSNLTYAHSWCTSGACFRCCSVEFGVAMATAHHQPIGLFFAEISLPLPPHAPPVDERARNAPLAYSRPAIETRVLFAPLAHRVGQMNDVRHGHRVTITRFFRTWNRFRDRRPHRLQSQNSNAWYTRLRLGLRPVKSSDQETSTEKNV